MILAGRRSGPTAPLLPWRLRSSFNTSNVAGFFFQWRPKQAEAECKRCPSLQISRAGCSCPLFKWKQWLLQNRVSSPQAWGSFLAQFLHITQPWDLQKSQLRHQDLSCPAFTNLIPWLPLSLLAASIQGSHKCKLGPSVSLWCVIIPLYRKGSWGQAVERFVLGHTVTVWGGLWSPSCSTLSTKLQFPQNLLALLY